MPASADGLYAYEQSNKELITSLGGEEIIQKTIEIIAKTYAESIDPSGAYPDLSEQLAQAMMEDSDFYDNVLKLGEPSNDNTDDDGNNHAME